MIEDHRQGPTRGCFVALGLSLVLWLLVAGIVYLAIH